MLSLSLSPLSLSLTHSLSGCLSLPPSPSPSLYPYFYVSVFSLFRREIEPQTRQGKICALQIWVFCKQDRYMQCLYLVLVCRLNARSRLKHWRGHSRMRRQR